MSKATEWFKRTVQSNLRKQSASLDSGGRDFHPNDLIAQIGMGNILAISGGRIEPHSNGIKLPVAHGYAVEIFLEDNDTYTVQTTFTRSGQTSVKGESTGVYADQVGEAAYRASLYHDLGYESKRKKAEFGIEYEDGWGFFVCPNCAFRTKDPVAMAEWELNGVCPNCGVAGHGPNSPLGSRKKADLNPVDIGVKVGDIFVSSWGYEQTNIDFYEVTRLLPASVELRPIAQKRTQGPQWMTGTAVPIPGQYTGEPFVKRISDGWSGKPYINLNSYSGASLWDGQPEWFSSYAKKKTASSEDDAFFDSLSTEEIRERQRMVGEQQLRAFDQKNVKALENLDKMEDALMRAMMRRHDAQYASKKMASRPIYEIASEIRKDWGSNVNYAAKPYLDAMMSLQSIDQMYGYDSASSVVAYFLSNASSWRGDKAREIKKELNQMLKTGKVGSKKTAKWTKGDGYEWNYIVAGQYVGWVDKNALTGWWMAGAGGQNLGDSYYVNEAKEKVEAAIAHRMMMESSKKKLAEGGSYSPVPGDPFRWLEPPVYSPEHLKYKEMFPNGVPMRDEDMTPEQLAYWQSKPKISKKKRMAQLRRHALNEQSGHGESELDDVEVTDDNADERAMWPWELDDHIEIIDATPSWGKDAGLNVWAQNNLHFADAANNPEDPEDVEVTDEQAQESMFDEGWAEQDEDDEIYLDDLSYMGQPFSTSSKTAGMDWLSVGSKFDQATIQRAIGNLQWEEASGLTSLPAMQGMAIQKIISEFNIPGVSRIAFNGGDFEAPDGGGVGYYSLYGIEGTYTNGVARIYVVDEGSVLTPVASELLTTASKQAAESWREFQYQEEHGHLPDQGMTADEYHELYGEDDLEDAQWSQKDKAHQYEVNDPEDMVDAGWVEAKIASEEMDGWFGDDAYWELHDDGLLVGDVFPEVAAFPAGAGEMSGRYNWRVLSPGVEVEYGLTDSVEQAKTKAEEAYFRGLEARGAKTAIKIGDTISNDSGSFEVFDVSTDGTWIKVINDYGFPVEISMGNIEEFWDVVTASKTAEWYDEVDDSDSEDEGEDAGEEEDSRDDAVESEDSPPEEVNTPSDEDDEDESIDKDALKEFAAVVQANMSRS